MLALLLLFFLIIIVFLNIEPDYDHISKENFALPYSRFQTCDHCNNFYYADQCLSPYCKRKWWWFNEFTPLPWGNASRTPKWYYPPYTYIQRYYDGWY
jgi:hypothetical protein